MQNETYWSLFLFLRHNAVCSDIWINFLKVIWPVQHSTVTLTGHIIMTWLNPGEVVTPALFYDVYITFSCLKMWFYRHLSSKLLYFVWCCGDCASWVFESQYLANIILLLPSRLHACSCPKADDSWNDDTLESLSRKGWLCPPSE